MSSILTEIYNEILHHPSNALFLKQGYKPLYTAHESARIVIIGQAPGKKAQESGIPWNDKSGDTLREWLGVTREQFYDPTLISLIPMDFYYPGKGTHGDLPPRKDFAGLWHEKILSHMPNAQLIILIGSYAQKYYLGASAKTTLTETVFHFQEYAPTYFPLVHPSPLNFRWQTKNPWFKSKVLPKLQKRVQEVL